MRPRRTRRADAWNSTASTTKAAATTWNPRCRASRGPFVRRGAGARGSGPGQVQQRAADISDVDDPDEAAVADDRQVPEMPGQHGLGRLADVRVSRDDGRVPGHQVTDPDLLQVLVVRHRPDDVRLG